MSKRVGCVLVFRPGTSKEEAASALSAIENMLDVPAETIEWVPGPPIAVGPNRGQKTVTTHKVPFKTVHLIQEYDDEYGGPVWYIP